MATLGVHEAVLQVVAPDHPGLLAVLATINALPQVKGSETLFDMRVESGPYGVRADAPAGRLRALLLLEESKEAAPPHLHEALLPLPGVVEAYPVMGRHDAAAWVAVEDLPELTHTVRTVQKMRGVERVRVVIEALE
jgi:DNA-binding Lrp family transcriptional regulator